MRCVTILASATFIFCSMAFGQSKPATASVPATATSPAGKVEIKAKYKPGQRLLLTYEGSDQTRDRNSWDVELEVKADGRNLEATVTGVPEKQASEDAVKAFMNIAFKGKVEADGDITVTDGVDTYFRKYKHSNEEKVRPILAMLFKTWLKMPIDMSSPSAVAVGETWKCQPEFLEWINFAAILKPQLTCKLLEVRKEGASRLAMVEISGKEQMELNGEKRDFDVQGQACFDLDNGYFRQTTLKLVYGIADSHKEGELKMTVLPAQASSKPATASAPASASAPATATSPAGKVAIKTRCKPQKLLLEYGAISGNRAEFIWNIELQVKEEGKLEAVVKRIRCKRQDLEDCDSDQGKMPEKAIADMVNLSIKGTCDAEGNVAVTEGVDSYLRKYGEGDEDIRAAVEMLLKTWLKTPFIMSAPDSVAVGDTWKLTTELQSGVSTNTFKPDVACKLVQIKKEGGFRLAVIELTGTAEQKRRQESQKGIEAAGEAVFDLDGGYVRQISLRIAGKETLSMTARPDEGTTKPATASAPK